MFCTRDFAIGICVILEFCNGCIYHYTVEPRLTKLLGGKGSGPLNRIVKYTNLHINRAFGGRGKVPVNRGTRYILSH